MKKILLGMASVAALSAAVPAAAQYSNQYNPNQNSMRYGFNVRIGHLETRLQAGIRQGTITPREARALRLQLRELSLLERRYSVNGLTRQERNELQQRFRNLRQQIRLADGGGYDRYDRDDRYSDDEGRFGRADVDSRFDANRDGWDDRDRDRDGRLDVDSRYDSNRDGWDDRDRDRDGRLDVDSRYDSNRDGWDDRDRDRDGRLDVDSRFDANRDGFDDRDLDRDGRWEDDRDEGRYPSGDNRGLVERVIDGALGGGGLRVGQRASANLGAVPYEYRAQYRDGNGAYYRADSRAIYQIDARAHTVIRIYPMNR